MRHGRSEAIHVVCRLAGLETFFGGWIQTFGDLHRAELKRRWTRPTLFVVVSLYFAAACRHSIALTYETGTRRSLALGKEVSSSGNKTSSYSETSGCVAAVRTPSDTIGPNTLSNALAHT